VVLGVPSSVAATTPEYELKAEFLERFTQFIEWPDEQETIDTPFVVCLVGKDPFQEYLQTMSRERRIKGRPLEVQRFSQVQQEGAAAPLSQCELVFISREAQDELDQVLAQTAGRPVLTVSDSEGFAQKGVLINFDHEGGKVRFEVNVEAMRKSGLKFSAHLMRLARLVNT